MARSAGLGAEPVWIDSSAAPHPNPLRASGERGDSAAASLGSLLASAYPDRIAMARGRRGNSCWPTHGQRRSRGTTGSPKSRSSPSARSPDVRRRRAFCSPRRFRSTTSRGSPAARSRQWTNPLSTAPPRPCGRDAAAGSARSCWPSRRRGPAKTRRPRSAWRGRPFTWACALAVDRDRQAMARPRHVSAPGRRRPMARPVGRGACRRPRLAAPFLTGKTRLDVGADYLARAPARVFRGISRAASTTRPNPFPCADRDPSADRLRGRRRPCDCAAGAGTVRAQGASVAGRRAHSADARASFRPPTGRSRSPATCRASGAAPGPPSAPISAAATPAISGPRTPRPPRRRRGPSRGGREGEGLEPDQVVSNDILRPSDLATRRIVVRRGSPVLLNER